MYLFRKSDKSVVLACFSPPVMAITFTIEALLAIYVLVRYKMSSTTRLIAAMVVNLGLFQLAEYFVCTQSSTAQFASRAGYAAITLLPPIGLHLMSHLTIKFSKKTLFALYGVTFTIAAYFLTAPSAFDGYRCTGNYVIFQIGMAQFYIYSLFYFGLITISIAKGMSFLEHKKTASLKSRLAVKWMIISYLVFIVPVAILVVLHPDTRQAVPSIMCGFAITTALIVALKIAPLKLTKKVS